MLDQLAQNTDWFIEHGVKVAARFLGTKAGALLVPLYTWVRKHG